jgi:hypothetical protein
MAKVVDRVFVYDDRMIAISLPPDFGIVLDMPEAAPNQVLEAVSERITKSASTISSGTRTQDGSDGLGTLIGYTIKSLSGPRLSVFITS